MVGGFALVAYPARYRNSGLMTFLVNHQGTIYEKDLGWRTTDIALEMTSFDPDSTWRRVTSHWSSAYIFYGGEIAEQSVMVVGSYSYRGRFLPT